MSSFSFTGDQKTIWNQPDRSFVELHKRRCRCECVTHGLHFHTNQSQTVTYLRWQVIRSNSTLNKMMHIVESWNLWPFKSLEVFLPDTDQSCRVAPELRSVRHLAPHNKPQERSRASGCAVNLFSDWKYKGREIEKQLSTKKVVWNGISKENPWKARF